MSALPPKADIAERDSQAWFGHGKSPCRLPHCSMQKHFMNSFEFAEWSSSEKFSQGNAGREQASAQ